MWQPKYLQLFLSYKIVNPSGVDDNPSLFKCVVNIDKKRSNQTRSQQGQAREFVIWTWVYSLVVLRLIL